VYELETYSLNWPDEAASLFLFIHSVAKKAIEYAAQFAMIDMKSLPPFASGYQGWKTPPQLSGRDNRKRKRGDDDSSVHDSVSNREGASGGSGGVVEQGIEDDLDNGDLVPGDGSWAWEMNQWAQEALESLASLGDWGKPLRAKSVRSI
jgi:hypothetical protein